MKKEFRKLGSMSLILLGGFLILEHIYSYGFISLGDILGHEWIGIIFIIGGLIWANKKWSEKVSRFRYLLNKLKFLKGGKK